MTVRLPGQMISIGGTDLSVYEAGSGPAVLFLHGNASRRQH